MEGGFYPDDLPRERELVYAAEHFDTIEVNGHLLLVDRPGHLSPVARICTRRLRLCGQGKPLHHTHEANSRLHDVLANFMASVAADGDPAKGQRT